MATVFPATVFQSYDGTKLAYHERGTGAPLICLPGGPAAASAYLGDLGGLSAHRRLVLLDPRGAGESEEPADPDSYACERMVADVEALRRHLGLDRIELLGHSAGGSLATLYAAAHPDRIARLVQVAPSARAIGARWDQEEHLAAIRARSGEPWFDEAFAAYQRLGSGVDVRAGDEDLADRFMFGRWTAAIAAAAIGEDRGPEVAARYNSYGDPERTRAALAAMTAPVLMVGGELDPNTTPRLLREHAALYPNVTVTVLPGLGHHPFAEDPDAFVASVAPFLGRG